MGRYIFTIIHTDVRYLKCFKEEQEKAREIIHKRLYSGSDRAGYIAIWKCGHKVCTAALFAEPDRLGHALWNSDSVRFYPFCPAIAGRRHCGGQGE